MERLVAFSLRRPGATLALLALATAVSIVGALRIGTEAGYRAFLGADHPAVRELDAFVARFGGGLPVAAVFSCEESACESVFDPRSLAMAHDVARALESTPGVKRVDSPATSPLLVPVPLDLPESRRLAPAGVPAPDLDALVAAATSDPTWVGQLVSADGRAGALLVHLASSDSETGARVLAALRALLAPHERDGFRFHLVGGPVEFVVAGDELAANTARLVPGMVLLVGLVVTFLFRSPASALASLGSVGVALALAAGFQGWLGWPRNSFTQALAPLVLVIGICDAVHVVAGYAMRLSSRPEATLREREAMLRSVTREVGRPCLFTTLTTAAGFASFSVSGLESLVRFGWTAAFGVGAALVTCFTLLPILLVRLPPRRVASPRASARFERGLARLSGFSRRRAPVILVASALLLGAGAVGFARLRVDASFEDLYGEDSQVVRWARGATRYLRQPETLEIAIRPAEKLPLHEPRALRAVSAVESLAALDGLGPSLSVLTPMRRLHRLVHHSDLALDDSAESAERARRMLRLLRFEDPQLVDLFVDAETGSYRVSIQAAKLPQDELRALLAEVDLRLARALPPGWEVTVTGPVAVVAALIDEIRSTQLQSFALAGGLVLALIGVFFRSAPAAALALVPTVLPVVATLGLMGLAGIALDVGSAMVAAVVLGLAVDDAIHLLSAYRRRRAAGEPGDAAVAGAVGEVGRALVTTSIALATGFLALALAPWQSIASFGLVAAVAILAALAAVLIVLPALLSVVARER